MCIVFDCGSSQVLKSIDTISGRFSDMHSKASQFMLYFKQECTCQLEGLGALKKRITSGGGFNKDILDEVGLFARSYIKLFTEWKALELEELRQKKTVQHQVSPEIRGDIDPPSSNVQPVSQKSTGTGNGVFESKKVEKGSIWSPPNIYESIVFPEAEENMPVLENNERSLPTVLITRRKKEESAPSLQGRSEINCSPYTVSVRRIRLSDLEESRAPKTDKKKEDLKPVEQSKPCGVPKGGSVRDLKRYKLSSKEPLENLRQGRGGWGLSLVGQVVAAPVNLLFKAWDRWGPNYYEVDRDEVL